MPSKIVSETAGFAKEVHLGALRIERRDLDDLIREVRSREGTDESQLARLLERRRQLIEEILQLEGTLQPKAVEFSAEGVLIEASGTVARIVGDSLIYLSRDGSAAQGSLAFTPEVIDDYDGRPLRDFGIVEGARVTVLIEHESGQVVQASVGA